MKIKKQSIKLSTEENQIVKWALHTLREIELSREMGTKRNYYTSEMGEKIEKVRQRFSRLFENVESPTLIP